LANLSKDQSYASAHGSCLSAMPASIASFTSLAPLVALTCGHEAEKGMDSRASLIFQLQLRSDLFQEPATIDSPRDYSIDSHHLTVSHDLHRQRRKHLESFFSRQGVTRVEGIIAGESRRLDERLTGLAGTGTVIRIDHAFTSLTGDLIGHIACGQRPGLIDGAEFSPGWCVATQIIVREGILIAYIFSGTIL